MKRILICSYYFPPCNVVAAQRPQSFADNFQKYGLHPVIATRHWNGDENSTEGYESENLRPPKITENENYTLIELPYRAQLASSFHRHFVKNKFLKLVLYASLYSRGIINPKCNADVAFHNYLESYLRENPVDYILATGFPMNTIRLGYRLANKFKKPFVADFRDLWDNNLLSDDYSPPLSVRVQNWFYEFYLRSWLKLARLVTSVSQPLLDEVKRLAPHAEALVIRNGFEQDVFSEARKLYEPPKEKFIFSVIGTLKPNQELSLMIEGLESFLKEKNIGDIELNFVGIEEFPEVRALIQKSLPSVCTKASDRLPRADAIKQMCSSHVLFYSGWRGHRGIASAKIYEYLGARRNILIAPNDRDVLEKIIKETNAGRFADTPQEFADVMNSWFAEWKATGRIEYRGIDEVIQNYTREKQAEKLAQEILRLE